LLKDIDDFPLSWTLTTFFTYQFSSDSLPFFSIVLPKFSSCPLWADITVPMEGAVSPPAQKVCHTCHVARYYHEEFATGGY
jgi:hypothetical protein